ncbi:MAG: RecB family exonuclease [Limisphaerales bacterium]
MIATLLTDREERVTTLPHLSHSQVSKWLNCGEQYRLYYVERLRAAVPSATLVFGQVVHQALAHLFQKKGDPVQYFRDTWKVLKEIKLQYNERDSWEKLNASGQGLLGKFVFDELPKISGVSAVEQPFTLNLRTLDLPFVGVIDLKANLKGKSTVVDFKTSGSAYGGHEAAMADQLTAYSLAEPGIAQLALCVLVKTKDPKIEWHLTSRTAERLTDYIGRAGYVAQEIALKHFPKRPGTWCAWCDYLPVCLGNKREADETLVKIA